MIEIDGLVKRFGAFTAVDHLDMRVEPGAVHGFLGPNGAGKSTTIRVLLGLYRATAGRVRVLGLDPLEATRRISYVPGEVTLWRNLTGQEVLDALAGLRGSRDAAAEKRLAADFALDTRRRVRTYSKGNRQKVALVAAFAAPTDLLVLDEPTSGLDPLMEELFQRCVRDAVSAGRTVLLSSHLLGEVEDLCDSVTIIKDGRLVEPDTNSWIADRTAVALRRDPRVHGRYVQILVQNRVVILLGEVGSARARVAASQATWTVPGVYDVCNRLDVVSGPPAGR
ncbi:ATP-binding cassette domain-containing protein [Actinoplanes sp. NPDC026619]|uniref:ATP-binding cassette domain-containing protein n=1 Tax=Actinoplanes sp. NPDC026619 TaxID=3155798 RepID=UPI0033C8943D